MAELRIARSELILGGPQSGKTARAESLALCWLGRSDANRAVFVATAQAWDDEMRERIVLHQRRRARQVPRLRTVEEPLELAHAIGRYGRPDTLVIADCLTLWLTASMMTSFASADPDLPAAALALGEKAAGEELGARPPAPGIAAALIACAGPIVLISNEPGPPLPASGESARAFLDALGGLNREAAAACERVTLMSAGQPLTLKAAV